MFDKLVSVYDAWSKGGRAMDLEQLAMEEGFQYSRREPLGEQLSQIKGFELIKKKGNKRLLGILESELAQGGGVVRSYDFLRTYELETYTTSVIEIYSDDLHVDYFKIEPAGMLSGTRRLFGQYQKPHPQLKAFHKSFLIKSEGQDLDSLFSASALDLLLDYPKWTVEGNGSFFIFYLKNKPIPVLDIMPMIHFAEDFVAQLNTGGGGDFV